MSTALEMINLRQKAVRSMPKVAQLVEESDHGKNESGQLQTPGGSSCCV